MPFLTKHLFKTSYLFVAFCMLFTSCGTNAKVNPVCGTIEAPLTENFGEAHLVKLALHDAIKYRPYEILNDTVTGVSVWCIAEADDTPNEGYGITITKNSVSTAFPHIRHTRQPHAVYDIAKDCLWLATSAMEGTGVWVERLYQICFVEDSAFVSATVDPYSIQQSFCRRLSYRAKGENILFYIDQKPSVTVTNTVTDMGGFDDNVIWVGENITFDLSSAQPLVCIIPGVKFITGLVLFYDDMPTFTANMTLSDDGDFVLGEISTVK